jgi:hypothetical protein
LLKLKAKKQKGLLAIGTGNAHCNRNARHVAGVCRPGAGVLQRVPAPA